MILRLEAPADNPSLRGGVVKKWHVAVGDEIAFGDDVCTVAYDDFAALRRTARATLLAGRRRKNLRSKLEHREGKVLVDVTLRSAEAGTLGKIILEPGDRFSTGDTLGVVSTEPDGDEATGDDWNGSPAMRVVANMSTDSEQV